MFWEFLISLIIRYYYEVGYSWVTITLPNKEEVGVKEEEAWHGTKNKNYTKIRGENARVCVCVSEKRDSLSSLRYEDTH